jgi:hypothetical protein
MRKGERFRKFCEPMDLRTRAPTPSSTSSAYTCFMTDRDRDGVPAGAITGADNFDALMIVDIAGFVVGAAADRPSRARLKLKAMLIARRSDADVKIRKGGIDQSRSGRPLIASDVG